MPPTAASADAAQPASSEPTLRGEVRRAVERAWARAIQAGVLVEPAGLPSGPAGPSGSSGSSATERPAVLIERPGNQEHGDAATNLAMKLARPYRRAPLDIARAIADELAREAAESPGTTPVGSVDVAAPGFINVRYSDRALIDTVARILRSPQDWGQVPATSPRTVNVEFVSANPTGPLTLGNARGAFVGDLLCRILAAAGNHVTREYYFNDSGSQVGKLGASVVALRRGESVAEDGYHGDYVGELAAALPAEVWEAADAPGADVAGIVGGWASERVRAGIEASLDHLGVHFDVWKTERSLHDEGWVERAIERLRAGGHVFELDGATWFRSTAFGDDKDRVIVRSNGEPTYFASDIGYVTEKFSRGFDELIYIWGQDHHGTVARVRNAAQAMGYDKAAVRMLLVAWVRFVRDGQDIAMSKRAGTFITLDELLAEIGVDAARWFFASRGPSSAIDFDIELAKKQSAENPVYYVQYAHARIASILRKGAEAGLLPAGLLPAGLLPAGLLPAGSVGGADGAGGAVGGVVGGVGAVAGIGSVAGEPGAAVAGILGGALAGEPEATLVRQLVRLPEVVEDASAVEEAQGVTAYATELATTFHAFYRDAKVVDPAEPERSAARLALVAATKVTLANALGLLGISAPEQM